SMREWTRWRKSRPRCPAAAGSGRWQSGSARPPATVARPVGRAASERPGELQELGCEERGRGDDRTEKIAFVESFGVGFDVYCMFWFVKIICDSGAMLLLYTDGARPRRETAALRLSGSRR